MAPSGKKPVGLVRRPEHDLSRREFRLDLRALNLLEGLRAALSIAVIVAADQWLHWPPMREAALAAWLTCLCDQGGPIRRRLPAVLAFAVFGALLTGGAGLARAGGLPVVIPFASLALFCLSFIRLWGQQAMVTGNLLAVTVVLALDQPLRGFVAASGVTGAFLGGAFWAALLTMIVWRMHPYLPARRAVSFAWIALATDVQDLRERLRTIEPHSRMWEEHARAQRRAVRDAIEQARSTLMDTVRTRGAPAPRAAQMFIRLETADQLFNALIALSDLLEQHREEDRLPAERLLRRLRPIALVLGRAIQTDSVKPNRQVERSIAAIEHDMATMPEDSQLRRIGTVIAERLRVALTLNVPANYSPGATASGHAESLGARLLGPLRSNLSWNSVAFRHALRTTIVVAPAIAATVIWYQPYEHWFTITLVMTLQPYFALTITRALERIGGTILGGLLAALIALVCTSPVSIAVAMFPLAMAALAVRQVSFGLFTAAITPIVVLLSELGSPGTSEWAIAGMRALLTVSGGLVALLAAFLLWPSWEPARLPAELRAAIAAHAAYARATFACLGVPNSLANREPGAETAFHETRRVAGIASNNLEASLSRVLQEPRQMASDEIEAVMVIDAALRRLAGRLSVMQLDPALAGAPRETLIAWEDWLCVSLERLSAPALPALDPRPADLPGTLGDSLSRAARQVELMAGAIARIPAWS